MTKEEFETLAIDLLEATMNIASQQKMKSEDLLREHKKLSRDHNEGEPSSFDSKAACVAYAIQFGIKAAFEAWSILRKGPVKSHVGNITILGGGCCFELPVLLHFLRDTQKEIHVKVIDPVAHWKIFQPMHVRLAGKMGIRLHLDYVPVIDLLEQIDSYKTDLLVSFNGLSELSFGERKALRIAYATCNRHLIWHSSLSVMQEVFSASYIPMRDDMNFHAEKELVSVLGNRFPELAKLNLFANSGKKGFYLMHNLSQVRTNNAGTWAYKS